MPVLVTRVGELPAPSLKRETLCYSYFVPATTGKIASVDQRRRSKVNFCRYTDAGSGSTFQRHVHSREYHGKQKTLHFVVLTPDRGNVNASSSSLSRGSQNSFIRWSRYCRASCPEFRSLFFGSKILTFNPRRTLSQTPAFSIHCSLGHAMGNALILLLGAVFVVPIFLRFKLSPVIGYLIAGALLGPHGLSVVRDLDKVNALAEIGVLFFLFEMGLEVSIERLTNMRKYVFVLGFLQMLVTAGLIGLFARIVGFSGPQALIVGGGLAVSSTAFVLQLLAERGELAASFGRIAFAILLFQDLAVVPLLVVIPLLGKATSVQSMAVVLGLAAVKAAIALVSIFIGGNVFLERLLNAVTANRNYPPEAFTSVVLVAILGTAFLTDYLGLSMSLGAFLAGALLAETKYRHQIEADVAPFRGLLLGLFFMTVGMSADFTILIRQPLKIMGLVLALVLGKATVLTFLSNRVAGMSLASSIRTGLLLAQGGEFAFVVLGMAQQLGLLSRSVTQRLFLVVALSMSITPLLALLGGRISRMLTMRGMSREYAIGDMRATLDKGEDFVIIAGFGTTGQIVGKVLQARMIPFLALDNNPVTVKTARARGLPVFFGDVRRPDILRSVKAHRARSIVVTLDSPQGALQTVRSMRENFSDRRIFVRARSVKDQWEMQKAGAIAIVPEVLEAALALGGAVLIEFETPRDEVESLVDELREAETDMLRNQHLSETVSPDLDHDDRTPRDAQTAADKWVKKQQDAVAASRTLSARQTPVASTAAAAGAAISAGGAGKDLSGGQAEASVQSVGMAVDLSVAGGGDGALQRASADDPLPLIDVPHATVDVEVGLGLGPAPPVAAKQSTPDSPADGSGDLALLTDKQAP